MVLESLFPAKDIVNKPIDMLILSFIVAIACVFISYFIFPSYAGIIAPLLVTVAMTPVVYRIFSIEEEVERDEAEKKLTLTFFQRHRETILLFSLFFIGNFLAIFLLALVLPQEVATSAFSQQIAEIKLIKSVSASATGSATSDAFFAIITMNNLKVMIFSFLISLFIVTGSFFILSWNASIIAIYLASFIRQGYIDDFFSRSLGILPHAPVEMLAYFLAGIAGGILSLGLVREKLWSPEFRLILRDSVLLMGLSIAAVFAGAVLEVWA
ncbi:MAG: stage II sporulation protein M [Candidatus Aenigmarchaeota archaeon]|nr:stage II sporulation protein M [Candidatus Aenigmarchaeota archaeon]